MSDGLNSNSDLVLKINDLRTYFFLESGTVRAVDGVTLTLKRKATLGLVGESGCGKSITAMSIMRLIKSPPGRIVNGEILLYRNGGREVVDLVTLDPQGPEMRSIRGGEIAMVFQEPMTSLNPLYSVGAQIAEAIMLHQKVGKKEAMERALEMLRKVQISDPQRRLHEYPHQLSGGMRQRVMIAMALSCNPSILIADEPTTALDVTVQAQILDLMRELQNDFGSSIILITHNLGVVSQMADHVAVMYLGKIVEHSEVREIFHHPLHPYTIGLLNSVPVLGRKGKKVLVPIKGMVPTPTEVIPGCPFAPRCSQAMAICREEAPTLREVSPGHQVACWLY
ncbi:MAG: ABC transporter ATP-binding protein [Anaerolineae bacterium]|nr:ABC transporter ATP-binding protein [Anaerolineae bacterium]MDW8099247.1 ABC transporter ATP-binding protein [Anaerolineae bacterium]